ncbi:MAG TPA: serine protease [Amycolatopsis sp.]|nr:serine protease [Amycolatopsis sp.]
MLRRLFIVLVTAVAGLSIVPAAADPQPGYTGIVRLDNCSGSLVRLPGSADTDPALVLTNGHCESEGMPNPGEVIVDQPSRRALTLLAQDGHDLGTLHTTKIVYGTMTDTDVTLYQLDSTYAQIQQQLGGQPLTLADSPADVGTPVNVVSGYFTRTWSCKIERVVYSLQEAGWTWKDSIRYDPACHTIHGTSGSPIVDTTTGLVVGVNNTGNDDGKSCTFDNPCEVDENGHVTVLRGRTYGQQTYRLPACLTQHGEAALDQPGCMLPKPQAVMLPIPIPA